MDKKILLSVLIVALIGIVAATYQINPGQEILNPLASVETEEAPLTDVLTAPATENDAQAQAQKEADAQAQKDAQAQAQKDAQAKAQADAQAQQNSENQVSAGSTQQSAKPISSGDTIVVQSNNNDNSGNTNNEGSNSRSNNAGTNDASTNDAGSNTNTNNNDGTDNQQQTDNNQNNNQQQTDNNQNNNQQQTDNNQNNNQQQTDSNQITDQVKSTIQTVIQGKIDNEKLTLDMDSCQLEDGYYKIPAYYKDTNEFAGTFYVNADTQKWHFIDKNGNYQTEETPTPGAEGNGQLVTDE